MKLQEWQRYPLDRISTNIIDEQGENVIHKCVKYDKIDFLNYINSVGFSFTIQNKEEDTPLHLAYKKLIYAKNEAAFKKAKITLLNIINYANTQDITPQFIDALDRIEHVFKSLLGIFPAACGVIWRNEQIYT
ncbi:ankyrin repeat domain-containing protein [Rickettsia endosymbiont of Gonocerus acuteangulatus]|uniref:ankyrin repeat domain-containing protein n=1 Tax=Rickettsia endosymbiont of Gonocerus acuteangulatus TaxID=3066266 RepID=UPI00313334C6